MLVASLVAQLVKNPPVMQETWVWSLGSEDPLEKGKAPHSSILAWRIRRESDTTKWLSLSLYHSALNTFSLIKKSSNQKNPEREKIKQYN